MKNKRAVIIQMASSIGLVAVISYLFVMSKDRIMLLPFLMAAFSILGKYICLFLEKKKYVELFNRLFKMSFLCFMFGFLIFWCYLNIRNGDYLAVLFILPFWFIGINLVKRQF